MSDFSPVNCPRNSVAVTFDDGYRSNIKYALPVLKRFGIRPTIFVSTAYVDEQVPHWFDRLDYAMQVAAPNERAVEVGGKTIKLMATNRAQLAESYAELRRAAKSVKRDDREMLNELNAIATKFESGNGAPRLRDDDWSAVLTWDEIRNAKDSVDFGSHSVNHVRIGAVPTDVASDQLEISKKRIESETGEICQYFAYPDGHYNETVMKICAEAGYKAALTMDAGLNEMGHDPMSLKRISVPLSGTDSELLAEFQSYCLGRSRAYRQWLREFESTPIRSRAP